jgi:streptomycin 6-kinase
MQRASPSSGGGSGVGPVEVPPNLVDAACREGRADWLARVPEMVRTVAQRWDLQVGAPFRPGGRTAWVAPARSPAHGDLVLKVAWRHPEAEHEADGLRTWDGRGAVRLHAAEVLADDTAALLIERCRPGTALSARPEPEQDTVVAGLLHRLWTAAAPGQGFASLQAMCDAWADQFAAKPPETRANLDPGLAREGVTLFRALPATAERSVLLCTDLHAGNVLAAEREPWLVIDPKPHVGDPTYDVLQHILNCDERLQDDPRGLARRVAELVDVDPDRLVLWLFARCVVEAPDWPALAEVARRLAPR